MNLTIITHNKPDVLFRYYQSFFKEKIFNNFDVNFININSNYLQVYKKKIIVKKIFFFNIFSYYKFFKENRFPTIVVLEESNKNFFYFILFKLFNIPIFYIHAHENFTAPVYNKNISLKKKISIYFRILDSQLFNIFIFAGFFKKIDILFCSNLDEINYHKNRIKNLLLFRIGYKKYQKIIKINDKSFEEPTCEIKKKNIASFIDMAAPYHKDQQKFGYSPISRKYYFQKLNMLFKKITFLTGFQFHILPHPSYKKYFLYKDYLNYHISLSNSEKNRSLSISKLVFTHHSSAIFKAINKKKPIIQISSKKFNKFFKKYDNKFKMKFKLDRIYIEEQSSKKIKYIINKNLKNKNNILLNKFKNNLNNYEIFYSEVIKYYEK
jgi:hypothetical protein